MRHLTGWIGAGLVLGATWAGANVLFSARLESWCQLRRPAQKGPSSQSSQSGMIRRNARLRKEYIYRKSLEGTEREVYEKKRKIKDALKSTHV